MTPGTVASTDPTDAFAEFVSALAFDALPAEVVASLKRLVLDTLGTALAANALGDGSRQLLALVAQVGGAPEATIIGLGTRAPAPWAAFANGGMAHALNYDDTAEGTVHVGAACISAALACGERAGSLSGRELLTAVAAGAELMVRLRLAIAAAETDGSESHPQPTQITGYFGAAASASRALRLDALTTKSALGLAYMQAGGGRQVVLEGRPAKALYAGFSSLGGVLSALLAAEGLGADCAVFEGDAGFFGTYYRGAHDPKPLLSGLGNDFHLDTIRFKPWPVTGRAHPFIRAALRLAEEHQLDASTIQQVEIRGGLNVRTFCEPLAVRRHPRSPVEAEDSIPFAVAKALANRRIALADLQPDGLSQPDAVELAQRVGYRVEAGLAPALEVVTRSGDHISCAADSGPETLSEAEQVVKFLDCAQHAAHPIPESALREAIDRIWHLEEVPDCGDLLRLVSPIAG